MTSGRLANSRASTPSPDAALGAETARSVALVAAGLAISLQSPVLGGSRRPISAMRWALARAVKPWGERA